MDEGKSLRHRRSMERLTIALWIASKLPGAEQPIQDTQPVCKRALAYQVRMRSGETQSVWFHSPDDPG
jgi:hypothetical protein